MQQLHALPAMKALFMANAQRQYYMFIDHFAIKAQESTGANLLFAIYEYLLEANRRGFFAIADQQHVFIGTEENFGSSRINEYDTGIILFAIRSIERDIRLHGQAHHIEIE